eukprot:Polyplicarium_translucidae@DN2979_c0_g2_i2.p3
MSRNPHFIQDYRSGKFKGGLRKKTNFRRFDESKYNLVIDGNTASMSEFGLFRGNSILLWDSIFQSYYSDWFQPHSDYHPVRPNMSDFLDVLGSVSRSETTAADAAMARSKKSQSLLTKDMMVNYWKKALSAYVVAFPGALQGKFPALPK